MILLKGLKSSLFILIFSLFHGIAMCHTSTATSIDRDSLRSVSDTMIKKANRLPTAGRIWEETILSTPADFVQMGHVLSENWGVTAAYLGGITLFIVADKPVTQFYQDRIERNIRYSLPKLPGSSHAPLQGTDAYLSYSIMLLYGGSLITNYATGQKAALNSAKALAYSYLITQVTLKFLFARQRPDLTLSDGKPARKPYTDDPYTFFNFRKLNFSTGPNGTSFPSMHATAYFSVARVMAMEFDNYWIPYGAVSFLFCADLKAHQHWVGDMVTGGILGSLIGQGIVSSSRLWKKKQEKKDLGGKSRTSSFNYQVVPSFSTAMTGLTFSANF